MAATLCEALDLDDLFYQSVVDEEFRTLVLSDPGLFGLTGPSLLLPAAVEALDESLIDLAAGASFVAQCGATCSAGPITIVCDGASK